MLCPGLPKAPGQQVCFRAGGVQAPQLDSEQGAKRAGSTVEPCSSTRPPGGRGDSSWDFHQGPNGGCQGDETPVPQPRYSKDLSRAAPGSRERRRGPSVLSGRGDPASRAPAPTPQPAFGVGESVPGAHRDRHNVLPRLGHPGAQACVTLPATQHVTRVPGAEQQLRAPLGGQGRGLRGTAGLMVEGGRRRTMGRSSEPQGSREPCVFRGRNFLWCP